MKTNNAINLNDVYETTAEVKLSLDLASMTVNLQG